jgi:hypothetical protein
MKDLLLKYGVLLAKRYRLRDKLLFLESFIEDLKVLGYPIEAQSKRIHFEKIANLYVGDLSKAKVVFVAAYDTPIKTLVPNQNYYPIKPEKNYVADNIALLANYALAIVLLMGFYVVASRFNDLILIQKIIAVLLGLGLLIGSFVLMSGLSNRLNHNRNSVSVVLALSLAKSLKNKKVAFIFVDKGVSSLMGYGVVSQWLSDKGLVPNIILLDALASGDTLVLAHSKQNQKFADDISSAQDMPVILDKPLSDERIDKMVLKYFTRSVLLTSGIIEDKELVVKNTRTKHDYRVNLDRLDAIKAGLENYINHIE